MTAQAFVAAVMQIASEYPSYRLGGTGADGTCDCVGLIMGAVNRIQKQAYPIHSSNYFARWEMATLEAAADATITPGMAVFKARTDTGQLNERYKRGGRYDNGDYRDFYHVGVCVGVNPLLIVHCTSGGKVNGIAYDRSPDGWTHAGKILGVEYVEDIIDMQETRTAVVRTADGNPLKLRPSPSTEKAHIAKIPNGDTIAVFADAEGWAKVIWQGMTGYCMSKFLEYPEQPTADVPEWAAAMLEKLDAIIAVLGGAPLG